MPRTTLNSLCVAALLTAVFALIAWDVMRDGRLPAFDRAFAENVAELSEEHFFRLYLMRFFTVMGGVITMTCLAIAGGLWQWRRGEKTLALSWVAIVLGGALLNQGLKKIIDRERPPAELRDPFVHETNESFPSGHSMGAIIGYGVLAYAVMLSVKRRRIRLAILVLLALWVGIIGFSRMYLRAHWFSDVIAGFVIGLAWLEFCLAWVELARAPRATSDK